MTRITTAVKRRLARVERRHEQFRREPARSVGYPLVRYDASVRIAGAGALHTAITEATGLHPTYVHLAGELASRRTGRRYLEDMWRLQSPLPETERPAVHVDWLLATFAPHADYFRTVIPQAAWADLCLGALSEMHFPLIWNGRSGAELASLLGLDTTFNFTCV